MKVSQFVDLNLVDWREVAVQLLRISEFLSYKDLLWIERDARFSVGQHDEAIEVGNGFSPLVVQLKRFHSRLC